jgi:hypothetical protein
MANARLRSKMWTALLGGSLLLSSLVACQGDRATSPNPASAPTAEQPTSGDAEAADAVISSVEAAPVWIQPQNTSIEEAAIAGSALLYGDTIRTEGDGLAQVDLASGLAFRIGGDASLVLQPDNRLNLSAGQMLTWVEPGENVPTEIVTPAGIAGLRGTTLFVFVPPNGGEVVFFAWEGTIQVQLEAGGEEILLQPGEELLVRPGERDVAAVRSRVRRLSRREILQRRRESRLLTQFRQPLPTQSAIEATLEAAPANNDEG